MARRLALTREFLTRVEGHGQIVVEVEAGSLKTCQLQIVEAPRFFESLLLGRSLFEAQHISSRICGICACGHSLASIQAAEEALGVTPSAQTLRLRKLLLQMEHLDSHLLHVFLLVVPDLLGRGSFLELMPDHGPMVRGVLRMKRDCNEICEILVGRHVHPISCVVGGFTRLPKDGELERIQRLLDQLRVDLEPGIELLASLSLPAFERETEYLALAGDDSGEYPLFSAEVVSSDGVRKPKSAYRSLSSEFSLPHSTAKHSRLSRGSYMVGALARFNHHSTRLHPRAQAVAQQLGLQAPCHNPYHITLAQLVEAVHAVETGLSLVAELLSSGMDAREQLVVGVNENREIPLRAGSGVGALEVPRGLLFHHYRVDEEGIICAADCVIPTGQNLGNIEEDMRTLVTEMLPRSDGEIRLALEMLVRAYDPCISCATHQLQVDFRRH